MLRSKLWLKHDVYSRLYVISKLY